MSFAQNLAYAAVQVLHNFGAVAVVGGSAAGALIAGNLRTRIAWTVLGGWGLQAVSGTAFALVSYLYFHRLPDIAGIAVAALLIKIICVAAGAILMTAYLFSDWTPRRKRLVWPGSLALASLALASAAFLRWFS